MRIDILLKCMLKIDFGNVQVEFILTYYSIAVLCKETNRASGLLLIKEIKEKIYMNVITLIVVYYAIDNWRNESELLMSLNKW